MKNSVPLFNLLLWASFSIAQPNISVVAVEGFENPVDYSSVSGTGVNLTLTLFNDDDDTEANDLSILYLTEEMILNAQAPGILVPEQLIEIAGQSNIQLPVNDFQITTQQFRVGGNIVVIWPSYVDPLTDTLMINVNVKDTASIGFENFLSDAMVRERVLKSLHGSFVDLPEVKYVEIYNLKGVMINRLDNNELLTQALLSNQIYLVRVYTTIGTHFSFLTSHRGY